MAAEAAALFTERCSPLPHPLAASKPSTPDLKPKPRRASPSRAAHGAGGSMTGSSSSREPRPGRASEGSAVAAQGSLAGVSSSGRGAVDEACPDTAVRPGKRGSGRGVRRRAAGSREADEEAAGQPGGAAEAALQRERKGPRRGVVAGLQERQGGGTGASASGSASSSGGCGSGPGKGLQRMASAVSSFPMQALSAVNDVLFLRHGYHRQDRHGDPRSDARLFWLHSYAPNTCDVWQLFCILR